MNQPFKVEQIGMRPVRARKSAFREFCEALGSLESGQSFLFHKPRFPANYHAALSALQYVLGRRYTSRKEERGYRIGRIT